MNTIWPPPTRRLPPPLPPDRSPDAAFDDVGAVRVRRRQWLGRLVVALVIVASLVIDAGAIVGIPVLFVLVVPFEKLFPRHRGQRLRRPGLGTDLAYALASPILGVVGVVVGGIVAVLTLAWLPGLAVRPLVALLPGPLAVAAGILLFDVGAYWVHRWSHEVPFLWRFHAVHHSSERMDWISGIRAHPLDGAFAVPPFAFLLGAGFELEIVGALAVLQLVTGLFLHANVRWRLRPLHRVVITPEFHHWHHANEADAINTNYSIFLPIWDIVFGTYFMPRRRRPRRYGIDADVPSGIVEQLRSPAPDVRLLAAGRRALRHPVATGRAVMSVAATVGRDVWRSTRRRPRAAVTSSATGIGRSG